MSRPMTRSYLKRIGLRPGDIWPYEMEEAEARLRAATTRTGCRAAAALLDEGRQFGGGCRGVFVSAEAVATVTEGATADHSTAEIATADPSGGAPALLWQGDPGTVPEANVTVTEGATADHSTAEANVTITETTAEAITKTIREAVIEGFARALATRHTAEGTPNLKERTNE
jgi:hypothetical protein